MKLKQLIESFIIKEIKESELISKYKEFNKLYFNNELPIVPISINTRKRVMGGGAYPLRDKYGIIGLKEIELTDYSPYILPEYLDDLYSAILVHEMIHGWLFIKCHGKCIVHGIEFINKLKEILSKHQFKYLTPKTPARINLPNDIMIKNNQNIKRKTNMIG